MRRLLLLAFALMVCGVQLAAAVQPDEMLIDPKLEARARTLSRELRCMVCQNQSIDDSDAPLARDLRILVRERLSAGDNDREVLDFLVARYGEFVLLKPRFSWQTAVLWLTPLAVFMFGAAGLAMIVRTRRAKEREAVAAQPPLTPQESARIAELTSPGGTAAS